MIQFFYIEAMLYKPITAFIKNGGILFLKRKDRGLWLRIHPLIIELLVIEGENQMGKLRQF